MMISVAMINSDERQKLEMIAYKLSEEEALKLCSRLQDSMPQVGYHTIPHSVIEQGQAIRYAVDKDTYYNDERSKNFQPKG
jgi:hypothetical protein